MNSSGKIASPSKSAPDAKEEKSNESPCCCWRKLAKNVSVSSCGGPSSDCMFKGSGGQVAVEAVKAAVEAVEGKREGKKKGKKRKKKKRKKEGKKKEKKEERKERKS